MLFNMLLKLGRRGSLPPGHRFRVGAEVTVCLVKEAGQPRLAAVVCAVGADSLDVIVGDAEAVAEGAAARLDVRPNEATHRKAINIHFVEFISIVDQSSAIYLFHH